MARTQTMVQLTDEIVAELDREAGRSGLSRSALIRRAVLAYLAERRDEQLLQRYVEGYRRQPPGSPEAWGDLAHEADAQGHDLAVRLDEEERAAGLSW